MVVKTRWRLCHLAVILILNLELVMSSQEVLMKLTVGFSDAIDACKTELKLSDDVMPDFYNYWREDYQLLNRDFGCMVMCMASKLGLISEDTTLHHVNAHEFAKTHGADDAVAKQLVSILQECEKSSTAGIKDVCLGVLEIAKCFRTKMHELKWAPDMEVVIEEVMSDLAKP